MSNLGQFRGKASQGFPSIVDIVAAHRYLGTLIHTTMSLAEEDITYASEKIT